LLTKSRDPVVVNVGSLCGRRGLPAWSEHSGSKAALTGLTEGLRGEFARFGIDVLLVVPGLVRSDDLGRHLLRRDGRADLDFANATPPEVVADAILDALRTRRRETVVGRDARRILLVNRLMPRLVNRLLARKIKALYPPDVASNG
jgi:short-subunit dehydrogenase